MSVSVDASQVLRTVDDRMFGVNTTIWDNMFKDAGTLALVQAADMRTLRFPGGSLSDTYDWTTNKSYQSGTRTLNTWSWTNSFDDFAKVALALKAQVFITVNYGSGTAQLAADWVKYSNVTKGCNFKYWEIGNECYGSWEEDIHTAKWDPVTYAMEAKAYITAMKAVDPTIKIGVVVQAGEDNLDTKSPVHNVTNPRTGVAHHGWTAVVLATLKSLGVTPDYVIYHRYPLAPGSETDAKLLSGVSISNTTWADDAADLRRQVNDYLGSAGANVELLVTENNDVYSDPGKQSTSLVNGLFYADSFGQLLQTEIKAFVWWALHNGSPKDQTTGKQTGNFSSSLFGWRTYGDYGMLTVSGDVNSKANDPHPTYYAMKLLSHFVRAGDSVVKATSNNALLSVYAARRSTDGALTLLVINKSPTDTFSVDCSITGYAGSIRGGTTYSYGQAQDEAARTGGGSADIMVLSSLPGVPVAPSSIGLPTVSSTSGSGLQHALSLNVSEVSVPLLALMFMEFAPYSMTVLVIDPSLTATPSALYGCASGATSVSLSWPKPKAGSSAITYKLERATDSGFTANLTARTLGEATTYVDVGLTSATTYFYRVSGVNGAGTSAPSPVLQVKTLAAATGATRLANIATRAFCATGNNVTIGGFVVSGSGKKRVLVRAVGPSLTSQGLAASEVLADPTIEVHDALRGNAIIATNDNWSVSENPAEITAVGRAIGAADLLASDTKSAAMLATLDPGVYSFIAKGKGDGAGIVLLEIYDADATSGGATFTNIASRANCDTGNGVTIGGFVVSGAAPKRVLMRAVGPTLVAQGLASTAVLQDPTIELHDALHGNAIVAINDNLGDNANASEIRTTSARIGATALATDDSTSAALLVTLPPGVYSFVVRGKNDTTGITLVEVYDAD